MEKMKKLITILVSFLMLFTVVVPVAAEGEEPLEAGETQVLVEGETSTYAAPQKKYAPDFVAEVDANGDLYIKSDDKEWLDGINHIQLALTNGTVSTTAEEAAKKGGNMYIITNYPTDDDSKLTTVVSGGPAPAYDGSMAYDSVDHTEIENAYKSYGTINFWVYADNDDVEFNVDSGYVKVTKDTLKARGLTSGKYILYVRSSGYYYGYQKDVEFDYIAPRPTHVKTGQGLQLAVGTSKKVTWTSSDEKVATVDEDGYVKFKQPSQVTITASIDGVAVDTYTAWVDATQVELRAEQDASGNVYIRLDDKELMKNIAEPYTVDENGKTISEGGHISINDCYIGNYAHKKYDQTDIYYEYVESGKDAYLFVPVKTILAKGVPAGSDISVRAQESTTGIYKNIEGKMDLNIGCKPYPSDVTVSENGAGDIIIRSDDKEYLEKLVSLRGTYTDDDFFGIEIEMPDGRGGFRIFDNYSSTNKVLTLETDSDGKYFVLLKNSTLLSDNYADGEYKYRLKAYGYTATPDSKDYTIAITHGVKTFEGVDVVDNGDSITIKVNGENSEDWISKLVRGNEYHMDEELGYFVFANNAEISLVLTKDKTSYNGKIYNYAYYEAGSTTTDDKKLDYIVDNGDGTLTISKSNLKHGFVDGTYDFTFKVNGYKDVTVKGVKLSFGVAHNPVLYTDFKIEGNITPIVGTSTDTELSGVKITALNEKGERVDVTSEVSTWWAEQETSPYGETYYGRTSDDKFVSGKVYYLCLSYMYQWKGEDRTTASTIEYNGLKYSSEDNFMGVAPGSYMDTLDLKQFFIKQTVGSMTKINVPAAKIGLVYNGKSQAGVDTNKQYTVSNNTAVDAGEYTATVKPNPGYCWNDGTQVEKEVKFTIAKANPTGYKKPEVTAVYGKKLSEVVLPAEWSWVAESTVINGVGNKTYSAKYTPLDSKNYNSVLDTLTVKVSPKAVNESEIKVPTAGEITYGDKLSSSKLTETGWSWVDSSLVLTVKNDGAKIQYKVADDVNYDYSKIEGYDAKTHLITRIIAVTVKKANPDVKTPVLKAVYGQLLEDIKSQLDTGWEFVDALGTSVGNATLPNEPRPVKVKYTPSDKDKDNYNVIEREASLTVAKAKVRPETYTLPTVDVSVEAGVKLSTVALPEGWNWLKPDQVVGDSNIAYYNPDPDNYLDVTANVSIKIKEAVKIDDNTNISFNIETSVVDKKDDNTVTKTEDIVLKNNGLTETVKEVIKSQADENSEQKTVIVTDDGNAKSVEEVIKEAVNTEGSSIEVSTSVQKQNVEKENLGVQDKEELTKVLGDLEDEKNKNVNIIDLSVAISVTVTSGTTTTTSTGTVKELPQNSPVVLTVNIEMPEDSDEKVYEYWVVCVHVKADGTIETEKFKVDSFDKDNSTVSFSAKKFSTYAIYPVEVVSSGGGSGSGSSSNGGYRAPNTKA